MVQPHCRTRVFNGVVAQLRRRQHGPAAAGPAGPAAVVIVVVVVVVVRMMVVVVVVCRRVVACGGRRGALLDVGAQQVGGQEAQAQLAAATVPPQLAGVDHLRSQHDCRIYHEVEEEERRARCVQARQPGQVHGHQLYVCVYVFVRAVAPAANPVRPRHAPSSPAPAAPPC